MPKSSMHSDDEIRLRHMIEAAREAVSFAATSDRRSLSENRQLVLALVKDIEIVGEAAARVSEPTRVEFRNVPWEQIVAMRNRLVHAYFDINLDVVWSTVEQDLPSLIKLLEDCIPDLKEPHSPA